MIIEKEIESKKFLTRGLELDIMRSSIAGYGNLLNIL